MINEMSVNGLMTKEQSMATHKWLNACTHLDYHNRECEAEHTLLKYCIQIITSFQSLYIIPIIKH